MLENLKDIVLFSKRSSSCVNDSLVQVSARELKTLDEISGFVAKTIRSQWHLQGHDFNFSPQVLGSRRKAVYATRWGGGQRSCEGECISPGGLVSVMIQPATNLTKRIYAGASTTLPNENRLFLIKQQDVLPGQFVSETKTEKIYQLTPKAPPTYIVVIKGPNGRCLYRSTNVLSPQIKNLYDKVVAPDVARAKEIKIQREKQEQEAARIARIAAEQIQKREFCFQESLNKFLEPAKRLTARQWTRTVDPKDSNCVTLSARIFHDTTLFLRQRSNGRLFGNLLATQYAGRLKVVHGKEAIIYGVNFSKDPYCSIHSGGSWHDRSIPVGPDLRELAQEIFKKFEPTSLQQFLISVHVKIEETERFFANLLNQARRLILKIFN